jgi:hypothetical protein
MSWNRLKSVVRSIQSSVESEPETLAALRPLAADALEILAGPQTSESSEDLKYLLTKIQKFVAPWRPSKEPTPGVFYIQPQWAKSTDDQAGEALSILEKLPPPAVARSPMSGGTPTASMKVFISHSSVDRDAAEALVELLRSALGLPAKEIRCTSVDGYKLSAGADSNDQLRTEVFGCEAFVALLSPSSMQSMYVTFELGARWGTKRYLAPIMIGGTVAGDLRAPLSGIHAVTGSSESDMHQLISDLSKVLGHTNEGPSVYGKHLKAFAAKAAKS